MQPKIDSVESDMSGLLRESKEIHDHVEVIERDLSQVNIGLASASATQVTEFAAVREQLNRIESTIVTVATTRGSVFVGSQPTVSGSITAGANILHQYPDSAALRTQNLSQQSSQVGYRLCSCRRRTVRFENSYTIGWLRLLSRSENVIAHSKSCPYWNPRIEEKSTELAAEYINLAFGTAVKLAIQATRGAGGLSVSPLLTLRGFVRKDSPVFALFYDDAIYQHREDIGMYMDYASKRMLQLFRDGSASPYDVDEHGETILHVGKILSFPYGADITSDNFFLRHSVCNRA
jgi:hypothetical protein